ncbi:MAG: Lrp/AsnC family transcriptional regulator [bacterium]
MPRRTRALDATDKYIVEVLQRNARASNASIGKIVGLSEAAVRKRLTRLFQARQVDFVLAVNPALFGYERIAFIGVQVDIDKMVNAADALCKLTPVNFVAYTSGVYDLFIIGQFRSDEDLVDFLTQRSVRFRGCGARKRRSFLRSESGRLCGACRGLLSTGRGRCQACPPYRVGSGS